jgi:hypothetical protein
MLARKTAFTDKATLACWPRRTNLAALALVAGQTTFALRTDLAIAQCGKSFAKGFLHHGAQLDHLRAQLRHGGSRLCLDQLALALPLLAMRGDHMTQRITQCFKGRFGHTCRRVREGF